MEYWKRIILMVGILCGVVSARSAQENTTYTYDDAGRLIAAYTTRGQTNMAALYQYDPAGNCVYGRHYAPAGANGDLDSDALADALELGYFQTLNQNGLGDPDNDGLVNSNEFALGGHPLLVDTDGDEQNDLEEAIAGTALNDGAEYFYVTNQTRTTDGPFRIMCDTKAGRTYQLQSTRQPVDIWMDEGVAYAASVDGPYTFESLSTSQRVYRIEVRVTE